MDSNAFYATLVESCDAAIVAKDVDGRVVIWNPAAERLLGYSAEEMRGHSIRRLLPPDRLDEDEAILSRIRMGERISPFVTTRLHKFGYLVEIGISASPMRGEDGALIGISYMGRNARPFTEQQRLLRESEERFRMLAENIAQFAWIARPDGSIVWFNRRSHDYTGMQPGELQGWGWAAALHPDHADRVLASYRSALASGADWNDTFPLRDAAGDYRWFMVRATPARDEEGRISWWIGANTDVTEQREREQQIDMLLLEVNHRSKNLLSIIQALARRTGSSEPDFLTRFEERVQSLAINQDILVRREWRQVPLAELVALQLAFVKGAPGEVTAQGSECSLIPRAAEVVGMALHELATNSLKHGSLSAEGGRVEVGWDCQAAGECFEIWWRESGGPPVTEPPHRGFGTTLIRDVPRYNLGCEVTLEYRPGGLFWLLKSDCRVLTEPRDEEATGRIAPS